MENQNELISETSPYLLQHAGNPVHWKAYSEKIFEQATQKNQLIIISIGYAACHWCHIMEEESFENQEVANLMNAHYISVKVDREERPDVDHIYIEAVQLMTGSAGWPLNVVTLPDGRPVWGGTYFRKDDWMSALFQINQLYQESPEELIRYADRLEKGMKITFDLSQNTRGTNLKNVDWKRIIKMFILNFDKVNGGFGSAPKFMIPGSLSFLLKYGFMKKDEQVSNYVYSTLEKISQRGIFDQINGGFARYSTDAAWHIPHFEKMLYDNAQLITVYSDAYKATGNPIFEEVIKKTIDFVSNHLSDSSGSFYSSLDADSINNDGIREEGAYYAFTLEELQSEIDDFDLFSEYYDIRKESEWEGKYVLYRQFGDADFSKKFGIQLDELVTQKAAWLEKLKKLQQNKKLPRLDDKSLTSWNALMLKGLLDAYSATGNSAYLERALKNAHLIEKEQLRPDFTLFRNYKKGKTTIPGFLEDYAWTIRAFIRLYELTSDAHWIQQAHKLLEKTMEDFLDRETKIFHFTSKETADSFIRPLDFHDDVIPSSNSVMAENLFLMSRYFVKPKYEELSRQMLYTLLERIESYPTGFSNWLAVLLNFTEVFYEIAITGTDAAPVRKELNAQYLPNMLSASSEHDEPIPLLNGRLKRQKTLIYLCHNYSCQKPSEDINQIIQQLKS